MLFDQSQNTEPYEAVPETGITSGFLFDWETNAYVMEAGSPKEVTGVEAVKAWIRQVVHTHQARYAIYPANFGASVQDLMGKKVPKGYDLSELRRQLVESAAYCPAIREVGPLTYDGEKIHGTITLESNTGTATEVIDIAL